MISESNMKIKHSVRIDKLSDEELVRIDGPSDTSILIHFDSYSMENRFSGEDFSFEMSVKSQHGDDGVFTRVERVYDPPYHNGTPMQKFMSLIGRLEIKNIKPVNGQPILKTIEYTNQGPNEDNNTGSYEPCGQMVCASR